MQQKIRPKKDRTLPSQWVIIGETPQPQFHPTGCPIEKGFAVLLDWSAMHGWVCKTSHLMR